MNFEKKVLKMTANEIVAVMVEGLRNPVTEIDMESYGCIENEVCYGCAATNTICKLANISTKEFIELFNVNTRNSFGEDNYNFLYHFETCINYLRQGDIFKYNYYAYKIGIAQMKKVENLPKLENTYTEEQLLIYLNTDFNL